MFIFAEQVKHGSSKHMCNVIVVEFSDIFDDTIEASCFDDYFQTK